MILHPTSIPDVKCLELRHFEDERGFFMVTYEQEQFGDAGIPTMFVQDSHSGSKQNVLRGLHYQIRHAQGKLVRVLVGTVYDVAVDLRRSSPTFGQWVGEVLSADNHRQLWIPSGFAHGFLVQSEWAEVAYKVTDTYAPEWERTLAWNDPQIGITWPLDPGQSPVLSPKDATGQRLNQLELYP